MSYQNDYINLKNYLNDLSNSYYNEHKSLVEDSVYDALYRQLLTMEASGCVVVAKDSPTQRVGSPSSAGFEKFKHSKPMLSLDNVFNVEELMSFINKTVQTIKQSQMFCIEPKIDGLAVALHYENGMLIKAATRGDGVVGDDVTMNVKTIRNIPLVISTSLDGHIEIRGEVFMPKNTFVELNKQRENEGLNTFANPRNAASGTLKLLDPSEVSKRGLMFVAYDAYVDDKPISASQSLILGMLRSTFKFLTPPFYSIISRDESSIAQYIKYIDSQRHTYPYEIDGAVVKLENVALRETLGYTSHAPRWAIAYKYPPEMKLTKILNVSMDVGRTGVLTPVAELQPVQLSGTEVKRASLHNMDIINELDVRVGDYVWVHKAAEIIPQVVRVEKEKRTGNEKAIVMPKTCPVCQHAVEREEGKVAYKCTNPVCPSRLIQRLINFGDRDNMDIRGLGESMAIYLVEIGVHTFADLYHLDRHKDKMENDLGKKITSNLFQAIENSKTQPLERVIAALGIPFVGRRMARMLLDVFPSMTALMNATVEQMSSIEGIGPKIAETVYHTLHLPNIAEDIENLRKARLVMEEEVKMVSNNKLGGKTFVITGTLSKPREYFAEQIIINGGKVGSSISKNTDYLIVGDKAGSKLKKAQDLNVKILDEATFNQMIGE